MRAVAEELGNTPAVARSSYVDPRVVTAYQQGITIRPVLRRAERQRTPRARQHLIEAATARLIKRADKLPNQFAPPLLRPEAPTATAHGCGSAATRRGRLSAA